MNNVNIDFLAIANIDSEDEAKQILDEPIEPVSEVEIEIVKNQQKRKKYSYKEYYKQYYSNNKEKYNKNCVSGRGRGGNVKNRYKLSILRDGIPIMSEEYKTMSEIGNVLQLPRHTISMIYRGKYQNGGKNFRTKDYANYKIEKL
tara:strand:- start:30 stop:464 length:435 start_codon:yes stop_codon:yes gene_type:complete